MLAQIAGGDARATQLFNAHVRLGSLYALAAKPVSAPLALQRELASKVPVLAMKLPYLAMPEERRKRAAGWLWELPSFRMNVILILLAALLAGGIWSAVNSGRSGHVSPKNFEQPSAMGGTASSGNVPNASGNIPNVSANAPKNSSLQNAIAAGTAIPFRRSSSKNTNWSHSSQKTYPAYTSLQANSTHSLQSERIIPLKDAAAKEPVAVPPNEPVGVPPQRGSIHANCRGIAIRIAASYG